LFISYNENGHSPATHYHTLLKQPAVQRGRRAPQPTDLDGRGAQGEEFVARSLCVSVHVDEDVDSVLVDAVSCLPIARDLVEGKRKKKITISINNKQKQSLNEPR